MPVTVGLATALLAGLLLSRTVLAHPWWSDRRPLRGLVLLLGGTLVAVGAAGALLVRLLASLFSVAQGFAHPQVSEDAPASVVVRAAAVNVGVWLVGAAAGVVVMTLLVTAVPRLRQHRDLRRATAAALVRAADEGPGPIPVVVVDAAWPVALGLPGAEPRIVLSSRLCEELPPAQLAAVVAHEEAHLRWRHAGVARCVALAPLLLPGWAAARAWETEAIRLMELVADDAAGRFAGLAHAAAALRSLGRLREDPAMIVRAERLEQRLARRAQAPGTRADLPGVQR